MGHRLLTFTYLPGYQTDELEIFTEYAPIFSVCAGLVVIVSLRSALGSLNEER